MLNTFSLQIGDLVYSYPDQDDPDIQTIVSGKREFRELASNVTEPVPPRGELYPHQELVKRYLLLADRLMIFHRTGTGKTCTMFGSAEQFRKSMMSGVADFIVNYMMPKRTNVKKIYVLTSGRGLVEELRRQLVCVCTNGEYLTDLVLGSTTEASRKGNITKAISPYYQIMTYGSFTNYITNKNLTDEQIHAALDDTVIYVDEFQNLRPDPSIGTLEEQQRKYDTLHRVFHIIDRAKVIIASATPMVDNVNEIAAGMNLILPMDQQLDLGRDYFGSTLAEMEPYFRGKISYVRELDTGAHAFYPGELMDAVYDIGGDQVDSQSTIYPTTMSQFQESVYQSVMEEKISFQIAERRSANFVFPNGQTGKDAFAQYLTRVGPDEYTANSELVPWISNIDNLQQVSCKFAEIIRLVRDEPGNSFCFCDFKTAGGAAMLGTCFKYMGFEQYTSNASAFLGSESNVLRPYCSGSTINASRRIAIPPYGPNQPYRFALITSETPDTRLSSILELFNSPENAHGEYLKVIIGSAVSKTGLNLANVLQVHLVGPAWNQSNIYQSISRALRSTSHVVLLGEEAARLEREGLNPASARINVNIYQHAAITSSGSSVDITMYQAAEKKDIGIRRMERLMKQCAIDCQIHRNRNVRPTDTDGSAACDYGDCDYPCSNPDPAVIDESSYAVLYSDKKVDAIVEQLRILLSTNPSLTFDQIQRVLVNENNPPMYILFAIEKMVRERIPIVDRYGSRTYAQEDGQTVFLQRDYPLLEQPDRGLAYYTDNLHGIYHISLPDYVTLIQGPQQTNLLQQLVQLPPTDPQFQQILDNLNIDSKVAVLEQVLINEYNARAAAEAQTQGIVDAAVQNGTIQTQQESQEYYVQVYNQLVENTLTDYDRAILTTFEPYIYTFNEPVTAIQEAIDNVATREIRRGRRPNPETEAQIRRLTEENIIQEEQNTEPVSVHSLYSQEFDRVSYAVTSKFNKAEGRLRILKPSEYTNGNYDPTLQLVDAAFRDANTFELPIYNNLIQQELARRKEVFEQYDIYGTINRADNQFRIRDKTTEDAERATTDARNINRGKKCSDWKKPDLVELFFKFDPPLYAPNAQPVTMTRDEMINFLQARKADTTHTRVADMSDDMLRFFVQWYQSRLTKDKYMCPLVETTLANTGRLMVV